MLSTGRRNLLFRVSIVVNFAVLLYAAVHLSGHTQIGPSIALEYQPLHVDGADRSLHSIPDTAVEGELDTNRSEATTPRKAETTKGMIKKTKTISTVGSDLNEELDDRFSSEIPEIEKSENFLDKSTLELLRTMINCNDKKLEPRTYQKREFWLLENYVQADDPPSLCHESITYSTHAGFEFLDNIPPLVSRWMAPVSLAIHAPGSDFEQAVRSIRYLRQCTASSDLVSRFVTFHLFFSHLHMPAVIPLAKDVLTGSFGSVNCSEPAPYANVSATYKSKKGLLYPVNVARNIARDASATHYILASDVELYPSPNLVPKFLNMIARNQKPLNTSTKPRVFPISIFEVTADAEVPTTKTELKRMLSQKKAVPFHKFVCPNCHNIPQGAQWMKANETATMEVFHVGKRTGKFAHWEPIYIGTNQDPYYEERLSWEGKQDKMTQGYILCVRDYEFMILNNAFLVHKPGIKQYHRNKSRDMIAGRQSSYIKKTLSTELRRIFGSRPGCTI